MITRKISIGHVIGLLAVILIGSQLASAAPSPPNYRPMEIGDKFRGQEATRGAIAEMPVGGLDQKALDEAVEIAADTTSCISDGKYFLGLDDYIGVYFFTPFYLMADGSGAQIWVQADLSFPDGRGLADPVVTCDQAAYLLNEFENNMYPVETSFFGPPDFHDGSASLLEAWGYFPEGYYGDEAGRQIVLVENVRDDNYYTDFPLYIAGFYSDALEAYFDRNTMTIDAYDWANRIGPDARVPYLYEGVFAHEYQHLLHSDYDPAEENWINEGLSDWAEWLTGYGIPSGHVGAFADQPENSLVVWGDQGGLEILTDYGMAYMYFTYMYEAYGAGFIQDLFLNTSQGIASVNDVLTSLGASEDFADSFHGFSVATYANSGQFGIPELADFQVDVGMPGMPNPEAFSSPGAPPWGTDYHLVWGYEQVANLKFNGFQFNPLNWTSDGETLFGGTGDLIDNFMIASVDLSGVSGATLSFDTMYSIEPYWDFGIVQVSSDGGSSWTSLANGYTTTDHVPEAHPNIIAQLPGLTGDSGGWINMSFDLSAYDGMNILVAWRYMTDWSYNDPGWWVDNIDIAGVFSSDGSSTFGLQSLNQVLGISNNYTVTLIGMRNRGGQSEYNVVTILSGGYVSDWESIRYLFDNYRWLVVMVTFDAEQGVSAYADYSFSVDHRGGVHVK